MGKVKMTRLHMICQINEVSLCDSFLTLILGSDQTGTFSVPIMDYNIGLVAYGCSGAFEEDIVSQIQQNDSITCGEYPVDFDLWLNSLGYHRDFGENIV